MLDVLRWPDPLFFAPGNLERDIGAATDVSKENSAAVKRLLALAEAMREDLGDDNRVGENMRVFEADLTRRTKPELE